MRGNVSSCFHECLTLIVVGNRVLRSSTRRTHTHSAKGSKDLAQCARKLHRQAAVSHYALFEPLPYVRLAEKFALCSYALTADPFPLRAKPVFVCLRTAGRNNVRWEAYWCLQKCTYHINVFCCSLKNHREYFFFFCELSSPQYLCTLSEEEKRDTGPRSCRKFVCTCVCV